MKNIIICACALILSFLSGCDEYLDVKPKNIIVLQTTKDVKQLMGSYLYGITRIGSWNDESVTVDGRIIAFPYTPEITINLSMYSDNLKMNKLPEYTQYCMDLFKEEYYRSSKWENTDFTDQLWDQFYQNIGFFNIVIDALNKNTDRSSDGYKETFCEAKILRTLMFFNILKYFSPYNNNKFGIPVITDPNCITNPHRKTQKEVYEFLISELKSVQSLGFESKGWNIFYSKQTLAALLAQIYWFKAESAAKETTDWDNAIKYASKAIEGKQLSNSAEKLSDLFTGGEKTGVELNNSSCLLLLSNTVMAKGNLTAFWGYGDEDHLPVNDDLVGLYDNKDIRKDAFFDENMNLNKWVPSWDVSNKVQFWRIADLHLIIAEAYARTGKKALAENYLTTFKQSRITGYTSYTGDDVLGEILNERRKEFCFEFGKRWIDLKRIGKGFSRKAILEQEEINNREVEFTLQDDDYHYTFPIPLKSELGVNGNLAQNPVW